MKTYTHVDNVYTISFMAMLSAQPLESILAGLPAMFSYTEARAGGLSDRRLSAVGSDSRYSIRKAVITPSRIGTMLPTYRVSSATSWLCSRMKAVTPDSPSLSDSVAT